MGEVIEGRLRPMPSDPVALRRGTRDVALTTMAAWILVPAGHLAYLLGAAIGSSLTL